MEHSFDTSNELKIYQASSWITKIINKTTSLQRLYIDDCFERCWTDILMLILKHCYELKVLDINSAMITDYQGMIYMRITSNLPFKINSLIGCLNLPI